MPLNRALATLLAFLLAVPAVARDRNAPTGFMVSPDEDDDPVQKPSKNPDEEPAAPKKSRKKKKDADPGAWTEQAPSHGLTIVDENAVAPTVIRAGDLDSDRAGKPLVGGPKKGIGLVQPVAPVGGRGSFTFKASASDSNPPDDDEDEEDDDDEEPAPKAAKPASQKPAAKAAPAPKAPRAPSSMLLSTDDDDAPVGTSRRGGDDPFGDTAAPTPAPQRPSSTTVNLHDEDTATIAAPPRSMLPVGREVGAGGGSVKVEEVQVDYKQDAFIEVGRKKNEPKGRAKAEPPPRAAPAPEPPPEPKRAPPPEPPPRIVEPERPSRLTEPAPERRPDPAPVRPPEPQVPETTSESTPADPPAAKPEPRHRSNRLLFGDDESPAAKSPEPVVEKAPEPARRPVVGSPAPAAETPKAKEPASATPPASEDPFEKLNRELREIEGKPPAEPPPQTKRRVPEPAAEIPPEPEMAVKPIESKETKPSRDPSILGISANLVVGAAISDDPVARYTADLAYGVELLLNPSFAGPVALDLSFVRATRSGGTPFVNVDSAWHHIAARLLYVKEQKGDLFFGFGAGLLMTANTATYNIDDGRPTSLPASQLRLGADGSVVAGIRFRPIELRLDLRTLLRGGFRLDFLPTLGVGAAF